MTCSCRELGPLSLRSGDICRSCELEEAHAIRKKEFAKRVRIMERLLNGNAASQESERWCLQCERFHDPSAPSGEGDE